MIIVVAVAACSAGDGPFSAGADASLMADTVPSHDVAHMEGFAAAFPAPVPDDCLTDVSAGQHSFTCEGIKIEVSVPDACIESACGLIFDVPGGKMNASDEDAHTNMRALGKKHGFIVVQPTDPPLTYIVPLYAVLHRVEKAWHADPKRIHFTGFSSGGFITWLFLCKYADELAAVAPGASLLPCTPSGQTDVLFLAGWKDAVAPYVTSAASRDALIASWRLGPAQLVAGDGETYARYRYSNSRNTVLETLEHDYVTDPAKPLSQNQGHCFPGSKASSGSWWDNLKCKPPNAFHWGEEVVRFFVAHPRQ